MQPAFPGLRQRLLHDLGRDPGNLDVHLERGDPRLGPGHLEVHVAQMILVAEDVGQNGELLAFEDQAHRNTRDRRLERNGRVHHGKRATTDRRHRRGSVGFHDLRDNPDRVREVGRCRQNRLKRAPGQLAVTDLTPTRRAHAARFPDRIGREVVVEKEVRAAFAVERIDDLLVITGAERRHT